MHVVLLESQMFHILVLSPRNANSLIYFPQWFSRRYLLFPGLCWRSAFLLLRNKLKPGGRREDELLRHEKAKRHHYIKITIFIVQKNNPHDNKKHGKVGGSQPTSCLRPLALLTGCSTADARGGKQYSQTSCAKLSNQNYCDQSSDSPAGNCRPSAYRQHRLKYHLRLGSWSCTNTSIGTLLARPWKLCKYSKHYSKHKTCLCHPGHCSVYQFNKSSQTKTKHQVHLAIMSFILFSASLVKLHHIIFALKLHY